MALERYINFFTDFGFKRLFGSEPNKNLLIDFLNATISDETGTITSLSYLKNEQVGRSEADRKVIYDLFCLTERGESIIVEVQKVKQKNFVDRALFYSAFPIMEQLKKGEEDFTLRPVYLIGIMDFMLDSENNWPDLYRDDIVLWSKGKNQQASRNLHFIFLEMPKFKKKADELETQFDKWLFAMKNLFRLDEKPKELHEAVFEQFFEAAEVAKFSQAEYDAYWRSLKNLRDTMNAMQEQRAEGKAEGLAEGKAEERDRMIRNLKAQGFPLDAIAKASGMSIEYIQNLPATN